ILIGTERGLYVIPYPYHSHIVLFPENYFFSLLKDRNGKIWFSHNNHSLTFVRTCEGYRNGKLLTEKILYTSQSAKVSQFAGNTSNGFWIAEGNNILTNVNLNNEVAHYTIKENFNTEVK